ncbi:CubicO group peptidase (beta-lactamase class C family) [Rhodococcus sp. LBL1]|nr:CubicO group peptidase (beta-lactamase class C family) [Rhodococcus sp. LBL1]MDH6682898.1 CubicO group peptidase (beta-lactamase class C family) [Rhodococcus sp. LBL2]
MTENTTAADASVEPIPTSPPPPRRRRRLKRVAVSALAAVVVLGAGAFGAAAALDIPAPPTLVHLLTDAPSTQGQLFAARTVAAPAQARPLPVHPAPLPETVPWKGGQITVSEFLDTTHSNAFVVLRDGAITHEWYRDGVGPTTTNASWSVAKSIVSLLVGRAIESGKLAEDERLVDVLPDLATGGLYDSITIRDLLDMTSGVDVSENYNPYFPFTGTARMYLTTDLAGFVRDHRGLQFDPGTEGEYRSVDTQLLGQAVAAVEGRPLGELLESDIWGPIGAEDHATWNLDRAGGQEKAFCCINATARDYAKVGQLVLDGGRVGDAQVVPEAWIRRLSTPAAHEVAGWGYSAQWWHPIGGNGRDFSAIGVYGQYIYVDPVSRTVVVKLSDHGTEQDEIDTIDVFRSLAAS